VVKFSACDAPTRVLQRAPRLGFLTHLSARERQVWEAFRDEDGRCYLRFAPRGGPVVWMRECEEKTSVVSERADAPVAGTIGTPPIDRRPPVRPLPRTMLVGRYGSRRLFIYAGARTR
jgi:hypothetical protein